MVANIIMNPDRNKKSKVESLEEEEEKSTDYVSGLPDHILCEVLSRLSYDDIVRTSCLSKRWRYLWASLSRLRFKMHDMKSLSERNTEGVTNHYLDDTDLRRRRATRLVNSVYQVLNIRDGAIHGFSLSFDPVKDESTHPEFIYDSYTWVNMLQSRRVSYMNLDFSENVYCLYNAHASPKYLLPNQLFKFEFLTILSLRYCRMQLPITDGFALKSLRLLKLDYVFVTNKEMLEGILPNAPRLQDLILKKCHELTHLHLPCELVSLKRLIVISCFRIHEIKADTPNLEVFSYTGHLIQFSVNKSAPVTTVSLQFKSHAADQHIPDNWLDGRPRHDLTSILHTLPIKFPFAEVLRIFVVALKLMIPANKELCMREMQLHSSTYVNLKTFHWCISSVHGVDFRFLLHILQSCPSLETLTVRFIELSMGTYLKTDYRAIFHESNNEIWVPPDHSIQYGPIKNIVIQWFTAEKNQMQLIRFLLHKCTLTLELLTILPSRNINNWLKAIHTAESHDIDNYYSTAKMEILSTVADVASVLFPRKPRIVFLPLDLIPRASTN